MTPRRASNRESGPALRSRKTSIAMTSHRWHTPVRLRRPAPLAAIAVLVLLAGLWAGLVRAGWAWPPLRPALPLAHGPLMVAGVLGTLIGLERAVALRAPWAYAGPLLSALGAVLLLVGIAEGAARLLITLASAGLVAVYVAILRVQPALHTATMGAAAVVWLAGNGLWLAGAPISLAALWWSGFLVLVIAGERLDLSRLTMPSPAARAAFVASAAAHVAGLTLAVMDIRVGAAAAGAGMVALALWLLRYDVARHGLRQRGLPRFIAASLLSGYVWLGAGGVLWILLGVAPAEGLYDAMLHAVFLGFVFAMVFAHAPIVLPALLERALPFHPVFYGHLALLHASLVLRVAGDLAGSPPARRWGALLNAVALLLFLANTARALMGAPQQTPRRP
ncbi:MAG: hypothetical protein HY660_04810 [Armatimonadetes bacterium]|nr:hypothetical protein [Armatimonadota bacterium]